MRGTRHLRARARRRQAALPGAYLERRATPVQRHRARRSRPDGRGRSDAAAFLHGLGHPHRGARRGALQSDVLSRRLDLAARQRADRARASRATASSIRSSRYSRRCSTPPPIWICGGCPNCSAGSGAKSSAARRLYPVACAPQAWASATPFTLLEAALGLEFDAQRGEIRLRNPRLPAFLNEVILRELQLGPSSVDLRVRRHGDDVSLEVLRTARPDSGVDRSRALKQTPFARRSRTLIGDPGW